jgi:hypothetical protein
MIAFPRFGDLELWFYAHSAVLRGVGITTTQNNKVSSVADRYRVWAAKTKPASCVTNEKQNSAIFLFGWAPAHFFERSRLAMKGPETRFPKPPR